MISEDTPSSLPHSFHTLVALFDGALSDVRFPGVDADVLRAHEKDVASAEQSVRSAEQALAEARAFLREREQAALERGERALSYLRIFAADDDKVATAISGLSLARPTLANTEPRRRGRPRKPEGELFTESEAAEAPVL